METLRRMGTLVGSPRGRLPARANVALAVSAALGAFLVGALVEGCGGSGSEGGAGGNHPGAGSGGRGGAGMSSTGGAPSGSGGASSSGSGGASSSSGGSTGSGGSSGSGSGGAPGCLVKIDPVSPTTFINVEAAPGVKMKMRASAMYATTTMPTWSWRITGQVVGRLKDDQIVSLAAGAAVVEFPLETPDMYDVVATVVEDARCSRKATVYSVPPGPPAYVFRVTASDFPVQDTRLPLPAASTTASTTGTPDVALSLDRGDVFQIRPRSQGQSSLLPAYVRITNLVTPSTVEGDTAFGPVQARLLSTLTYDLLLVPSTPSIAPELLTAIPDDWRQGIDLDPGIHVTGKALASDGRPLSGARVILRRQQRPSTIGTSDDSGNFDLWTRAGSMSVMAVPPAGSGLPQANVEVTADNAGFVLPAQAASPTLSVQWKAVDTGALALKIVNLDGVTPVANARVRATSQAGASVATITANVSGSAATTLDAAGSVIEDAMTDDAGTASFAKLPVGTYDVTVVPSSSSMAVSMPPAITTQSIKVAAAGMTTTFTLARKATLGGTIGAGAKGASVTAFDQSVGLAAAPVTTTASDNGAFMLLVDPGRSYRLVVQPADGQPYARTITAPAAVGATRTDLPAITLSSGRKITGVVVSENGPAGIDRAFVQVFCEASSSACVDPSMPLAEAATASDGSFEVVLPASAP